MNEEQIQSLKVALWNSDPWKNTSEFEFVCLHCGSKYNGGVPHETHKRDCVWLVNYQEVESGLTPLAPDSPKAGVLSLPESVKVENALPAESG